MSNVCECELPSCLKDDSLLLLETTIRPLAFPNGNIWVVVRFPVLLDVVRRGEIRGCAERWGVSSASGPISFSSLSKLTIASDVLFAFWLPNSHVVNEVLCRKI